MAKPIDCQRQRQALSPLSKTQDWQKYSQADLWLPKNNRGSLNRMMILFAAS